jgi:hypothetical protein
VRIAVLYTKVYNRLLVSRTVAEHAQATPEVRVGQTVQHQSAATRSPGIDLSKPS